MSLRRYVCVPWSRTITGTFNAGQPAKGPSVVWRFDEVDLAPLGPLGAPPEKLVAPPCQPPPVTQTRLPGIHAPDSNPFIFFIGGLTQIACGHPNDANLITHFYQEPSRGLNNAPDAAADRWRILMAYEADFESVGSHEITPTGPPRGLSTADAPTVAS